MRWSKQLQIVGAHAEGEVGQVVTAGVVDVPGDTMLAKMRYLADIDDSVQRLTLLEPRGRAQMTVNVLVPPIETAADAAFIPIQPDGPHAMSGSNAMCVTTVLLETGAIPMTEPETVVRLDTPAGLVSTTATCEAGKCKKVSLDMPPSFAEALDYPIELDGYGTVQVDIAFGGCFFALVDVKQFGISIRPEHARHLVELASKINPAVRKQVSVNHPEIPDLNRIEYTLFCDGDAPVFYNANIIHPGRVDRSPCGTGTAARLAVMHARGNAAAGQRMEARSIIDSVFEVEITGVAEVGRKPAVTTRLTGRAWIYGQFSLQADPSDPFRDGYMLSDTWGPDVGLKVSSPLCTSG